MFRERLVIFVACVLCFTRGSAEQNTVAVSFDTLFPEMPLKTTLDTCMQIWGDIRSLDALPKKGPSYQEKHDLIVGRLVRLNGYIDQIIQELNEGASFVRADIDYLLSIIDHITYERTMDETKTKTVASSAIPQLLMCAREKMLALL